jgi:hypothetical protein
MWHFLYYKTTSFVGYRDAYEAVGRGFSLSHPCLSTVAHWTPLQDSSERDVLRGLTTRVEQLLEASRKADWAPGEPLPSSQSAWVNALLSYLQVWWACAVTAYVHVTGSVC